MPIAKKIVLFIGWLFVITGFIMRFTGVSFSGSYFDKHGWHDSVMDGKALILFGLVFLVCCYINPPRNWRQR